MRKVDPKVEEAVETLNMKDGPSRRKLLSGTGLISGRKAFQRPRAEGVELLQAIQDVYLCDEVTIA